LRVGGEMRILCLGCDHDMTIDRIKLEKAQMKNYSFFSPPEINLLVAFSSLILSMVIS